ncbi:unnamed protein product [Cyprideis torosa]|uniref:Uncharacterized protein n=1 Tax=Cyprideis torosa TaxID=163714 RepID=A0A7R8ZR89_9CRUS|nr:unnamed protein product [Cyprideis torosa]CAG0903120.1 unnamed protein product [Cyprideis torosa]
MKLSHIGPALPSALHLLWGTERMLEQRQSLSPRGFCEDIYSVLRISPECAVRPQLTPECAVRPQLTPECAVRPQLTPECAVRPQLTPECAVRPQLTPECAVRPQLTPECAVRPQLTPECAVRPQLTPECAVRPQLTPECAVRPQLTPECSSPTHPRVFVPNSPQSAQFVPNSPQSAAQRISELNRFLYFLISGVSPPIPDALISWEAGLTLTLTREGEPPAFTGAPAAREGKGEMDDVIRGGKLSRNSQLLLHLQGKAAIMSQPSLLKQNKSSAPAPQAQRLIRRQTEPLEEPKPRRGLQHYIISPVVEFKLRLEHVKNSSAGIDNLPKTVTVYSKRVYEFKTGAGQENGKGKNITGTFQRGNDNLGQVLVASLDRRLIWGLIIQMPHVPFSQQQRVENWIHDSVFTPGIGCLNAGLKPCRKPQGKRSYRNDQASGRGCCRAISKKIAQQRQTQGLDRCQTQPFNTPQPTPPDGFNRSQPSPGVYPDTSPPAFCDRPQLSPPAFCDTSQPSPPAFCDRPQLSPPVLCDRPQQYQTQTFDRFKPVQAVCYDRSEPVQAVCFDRSKPVCFDRSKPVQAVCFDRPHRTQSFDRPKPFQAVCFDRPCSNGSPSSCCEQTARDNHNGYRRIRAVRIEDYDENDDDVCDDHPLSRDFLDNNRGFCCENDSQYQCQIAPTWVRCHCSPTKRENQNGNRRRRGCCYNCSTISRNQQCQTANSNGVSCRDCTQNNGKEQFCRCNGCSNGTGCEQDDNWGNGSNRASGRSQNLSCDCAQGKPAGGCPAWCDLKPTPNDPHGGRTLKYTIEELADVPLPKPYDDNPSGDLEDARPEDCEVNNDTDNMAAAQCIYDIRVRSIDCREVCLAEYKGKCLLIALVAIDPAACTNVCREFQELSQIGCTCPKDMVVLVFPIICNDDCTTTNDQIKQMASDANANFCLFAKGRLGCGEPPAIFQFLACSCPQALKPGQRFLIDKSGRPFKKYECGVDCNTIVSDIKSCCCQQEACVPVKKACCPPTTCLNACNNSCGCSNNCGNNGGGFAGTGCGPCGTLFGQTPTPTGGTGTGACTNCAKRCCN